MRSISSFLSYFHSSRHGRFATPASARRHCAAQDIFFSLRRAALPNIFFIAVNAVTWPPGLFSRRIFAAGTGSKAHFLDRSILARLRRPAGLLQRRERLSAAIFAAASALAANGAPIPSPPLPIYAGFRMRIGRHARPASVDVFGTMPTGRMASRRSFFTAFRFLPFSDAWLPSAVILIFLDGLREMNYTLTPLSWTFLIVAVNIHEQHAHAR